MTGISKGVAEEDVNIGDEEPLFGETVKVRLSFDSSSDESSLTLFTYFWSSFVRVMFSLASMLQGLLDGRYEITSLSSTCEKSYK